MSTVEEHYRGLLARHYSWMLGLSLEEKAAEQRAILEPLLGDVARGLAVDLGSGPGYQSLALAQLGFAPVHAIDSSAELLSELESAVHRHGYRDVRTHNLDMLSLLDCVQPGSACVAVCMGDTLTHLRSHDEVRRLFRAAATALVPGGRFVLTWRDLTQELTGVERFISVRSDESRIMTCFLEYTSPTAVQVHDLVYTRDATGDGWALEKSSYPKLRLSAAWVADALASAGFETEPPGNAGRLCLLTGRRTSQQL